MPKSKLIPVRFLKPVSGFPFFLAYSVGQIGLVTQEKYELLKQHEACEDAQAIQVKKETKESKVQKEQR